MKLPPTKTHLPPTENPDGTTTYAVLPRYETRPEEHDEFLKEVGKIKRDIEISEIKSGEEYEKVKYILEKSRPTYLELAEVNAWLKGKYPEFHLAELVGVLHVFRVPRQWSYDQLHHALDCNVKYLYDILPRKKT